MRSRDKNATVQLSKIRMKEELRGKLDRDAEGRGISLNAAIVSRLERSFDQDEATEKDIRKGQSPIPLAMAVFFNEAAKRAAESDPQAPADWAADPFCFEQGALAAAEILWRLHPDPQPGALRYWLSRLYGRVGRRLGMAPVDAPPISPSTIDLVGVVPEEVE
jgi:hypothetical protein